MYQTDRRKQTLLLEGVRLSPEDILMEWKNLEDKSITTSDHSQERKFRLELFRFLADWFNDSDEMTVQTSGSTGTPKLIRVRKSQMMNSACATCFHLRLEPNDKVLLCMSLQFIAGKMMVIRSLVAGLDLYMVPPSGYPLKDIDVHFRFAAMVPMQIFNSLQVSLERDRLQRIAILLIGGSAVDPKLESALQSFPNSVYASYGMAETLSHIALRRINGSDASDFFTPLPSVDVFLSEEQCLIIDAPLVCDQRLYTNDHAEMRGDGSFRILGRIDNVINTGGIKVQTETLEAFLSDFIDVPFAISSLPDEKFGEIIVLAVEGVLDDALLTQTLHAENLPAHQFPKQIITLDRLPRTESGKINRAALHNILESSTLKLNTI
ncbi:MAG TPA: AMP-binding protein [Bacteroidales bacterium]|nr:AMP-binding protein [Bacteroidales bacterium]